jgi:hypothetical protein
MIFSEISASVDCHVGGIAASKSWQSKRNFCGVRAVFLNLGIALCHSQAKTRFALPASAKVKLERHLPTLFKPILTGTKSL